VPVTADRSRAVRFPGASRHPAPALPRRRSRRPPDRGISSACRSLAEPANARAPAAPIKVCARSSTIRCFQVRRHRRAPARRDLPSWLPQQQQFAVRRPQRGRPAPSTLEAAAKVVLVTSKSQAPRILRSRCGKNDLAAASRYWRRSPLCGRLTRLLLRGNQLGSRAAQALAESPHLKNLIVLDLAHTLIGAAGAGERWQAQLTSHAWRASIWRATRSATREGKALGASTHLGNLTAWTCRRNGLRVMGVKGSFHRQRSAGCVTSTVAVTLWATWACRCWPARRIWATWSRCGCGQQPHLAKSALRIWRVPEPEELAAARPVPQ